MKKVEDRKKVHLYIHVNDADRLRLWFFRICGIFLYIQGARIWIYPTVHRS